MVTTSGQIVGHPEIAKFAEDRVNLKRDTVSEYREQVNRLRDKLETFIQAHPNVGLRKMLLSGSLAKGTALSALNDIDVALYVESANAPSIFDNRGELLNWLAARLREAYPQMAPEQIVAQTHTVRISFRGSGLDVEVAPVWYDPKLDPKGQDKGYLINRNTGNLVLTSIPMHLEFVRTRKKKQPKDYAQTIRLIKWWTKQRKAEDANFRFRSFLAELLCARVADDGASYADYPEALSAVFSFVVKGGLDKTIRFDDYYRGNEPSSAPTAPINALDPVNVNNNVTGDYLASDKTKIEAAAERALDAIMEAQFAVTKGRAVDCWRRVLGPSFSA